MNTHLNYLAVSNVSPTDPERVNSSHQPPLVDQVKSILFPLRLSLFNVFLNVITASPRTKFGMDPKAPDPQVSISRVCGRAAFKAKLLNPGPAKPFSFFSVPTLPTLCWTTPNKKTMLFVILELQKATRRLQPTLASSSNSLWSNQPTKQHCHLFGQDLCLGPLKT